MWKCQYDLLLRIVLTSTPLSHWFLTWEAFCLSQEIIWRRVRNWAKEKVSGFQSHTLTKASLKLLSSLSANEQLADLSHSINRYEHSIQSVEQCDAAKIWSNANSSLLNKPQEAELAWVSVLAHPCQPGHRVTARHRLRSHWWSSRRGSTLRGPVKTCRKTVFSFSTGLFCWPVPGCVGLSWWFRKWTFCSPRTLPSCSSPPSAPWETAVLHLICPQT